MNLEKAFNDINSFPDNAKPISVTEIYISGSCQTSVSTAITATLRIWYTAKWDGSQGSWTAEGLQ